MTRLALAFMLGAVAQSLLGCRSAALKAADSRVYEVVFEGNTSVSSRRLEEMILLDLADFERNEFKKAYIDDAAYDLEVGYRSLGFPFAIVDYAIDGSQPPEAVRFSVNEGPRTLLEEARFVNMEHLAEANFDKKLSSKRTSVLQGSRPYYVESQIISALDSMESDYVELGYLEAEIELTSTEFSEDRGAARIVVKVEEGPRYQIGKVEVVGGPQDLLQACRQEVDETLSGGDRAYRHRTGYELRGMLVESLAADGYADAKVAIEHKKRGEQPIVDIHLTLDPGPRVRIARIVFPEDLETREGFLRSRLKLREGDTYDSREVHDSVRRLYDTGLFTRVSVELEEGEGEERTLRVDVTEAPSGEFFFEPGYGSYERLRLRLGFRKKNLWGTGRLLRVESTVGERAQRATVSVTDPWFLGSEFSADVVLRYDRRELPSFTQEDLGAGIFWTREWDAHHATSFGYQYRRSSATDVLVLDQDVQDAQDTLNISSVQAAQRFDTRDNFFLPTRGWFNEVGLEFGDDGIGSELNFLRTSLRLATYGRVRDGTVLASSFRTGVIEPLAPEDGIPIQERYFNGGHNSVRSFRFNELGPKDAQNNPLGGETFFTGNFEVRQGLTSSFQGAAFIDAGNVTPRHQDYFDFADIELGIGAGLRYLLPIGPVRLDVGFNPDPKSGDPDYVVHFSIGMAF